MGGKEKCKVKRGLVGRERMQGDETSMSSSLLITSRLAARKQKKEICFWQRCYGGNKSYVSN